MQFLVLLFLFLFYIVQSKYDTQIGGYGYLTPTLGANETPTPLPNKFSTINTTRV